MKKIKLLFSILPICFCIIACNQQTEADSTKIFDSIDAEANNSPVALKEILYLDKSLDSYRYEELLVINKEIIPTLIENIDADETTIMGFINPSSSYLGPYLFNQRGINYAYQIDYILSKDSVETVNKTWDDDEDWRYWEEIVAPFRIYDIGVIVKIDNGGETIPEPLENHDMILIKEMYKTWWEENKDKSIYELRQKFRNGKKILQDPYVWI